MVLASSVSYVEVFNIVEPSEKKVTGPAVEPSEKKVTGPAVEPSEAQVTCPAVCQKSDSAKNKYAVVATEY